MAGRGGAGGGESSGGLAGQAASNSQIPNFFYSYIIIFLYF